MKKHGRFGVLFILVLCSLSAFLFFFEKEESAASIQKKEQELGAAIDELKSGDVHTVSYVTHQYLFDRLRNESNSSSSEKTIELGALSYRVSEITDGYVLTSLSDSVPDPYHLILEQQSVQTDKVGQSIETLLLIKKQAGEYHGQ